MRQRILLIDNDESLLETTKQTIESAGFSILALSTPTEALTLASPAFEGVIMIEYQGANVSTLKLLESFQEIDADLPVILRIAQADVSDAVKAMRLGAYDFIINPADPIELSAVLHRALERRSLILENRRLRAVAGKADDIEARLPGRTQAMVTLRHRLRAIGASDTDVLIVGPTGAGKEVVARSLHDISTRAGRPFIAINCAALPELLIESELFGHEAGAFPGALRARFGKFEHARGGTVLLDEIGSMPLILQAKLLRVLQERQITRLGSNEPVALDIRFIATSKTDLSQEVAQGRFRADLYWRLNVAVLQVPALHERREDIPLLFLQLLREAAARHKLPERTVPAQALLALSAQDWPGNLRQLRNLAERYVLNLEPLAAIAPNGKRLADCLADYERSLIAGALISNGGQLKPVYQALGISRKTLYEKMQKYALDRGNRADPQQMGINPPINFN